MLLAHDFGRLDPLITLIVSEEHLQANGEQSYVKIKHQVIGKKKRACSALPAAFLFQKKFSNTFKQFS